MSHPRFLVASIADAAPADVTLPPDESHHAARVLRLEAGAEVGVFDGRGREWVGRVASISRDAVTVTLERDAAPAAEPRVRLVLAMALLKGDQMDTVIRDATMMGVASIRPVITEHVTVPTRAWQRTDLVDRWRRVAVASVKQCGRAVVPEIAAPQPLDAVLDDAMSDVRIIAVEPAHDPRVGAPAAAMSPPSSATLFVGPEGGWSAEELERARASSAEFLSLGPRTLRADIAPIVALAVLLNGWGW